MTQSFLKGHIKNTFKPELKAKKSPLQICNGLYLMQIRLIINLLLNFQVVRDLCHRN